MTEKGKSPTEESRVSKWFQKIASAISSLKGVIGWPLVIFILLIFMWGPISESLGLLPTLIRSSTKISVGSFSMEMERVAQKAGTEDLAELLGGLSPEAIRLLIETGNARYHLVSTQGGPSDDMIIIPSEIIMNALTELEEKHLLEFRPSKEDFLTYWGELNLVEDLNIASSGYRYYDRDPDLNNDEKEMLKQYQYFLTNLGKNAFDLVVQTIVSTLPQE